MSDTDGETNLEDGLVATETDFEELIKANPGLQLPLVNIIQKRLLAEKDAEIERLTSKSSN